LMKIVHIITRLILGGAQENTLITCRELSRRGHDVTLITGPAVGPEGELFTRARSENYKIIVIDELIRAIRPTTDFYAYRKIKKTLIELAPDIVHTHSAKAGILGRWAGYAVKGSFGKPSRPAVVHTIHGLAFGDFERPIKNEFYIAVEKAAAKRTDAFISVADAMTKQALAAGIGRPEMFNTAYSAIDEAGFLTPLPPEKILEFRRRHGIAEDAVVMATVARLFALKGHDFIIESAKTLAPQFPKAVWLFVGDGSLAGQIKESIHNAGLDERFKFTGLIPPDHVPLALQSSDILVHCSLREGLARAIPQAMLCGKPAVSFDCDGSNEVLNEKTGRLVKPKDIPALIAACAELLADTNLRTRLGSAARESVKTKFSPETMVNTIEDVYKNILHHST
jgi:glycosyltransferase involved in cell wall biosynthesis